MNPAAVMTRLAPAASLSVLAMLAVSPRTARPEAIAMGDRPTTVIDSTVAVWMGSGGMDLRSPLGVAIDTAGREVVVANTGAGRVEFFDWTGRPTGSFVHLVPDVHGRPVPGQPKHVAVMSDGRVVVVDALAPFIDVCDYRGRLLERVTLPPPDSSFEAGGAGPLAVLPNGGLLVASRARRGRVYAYDAEFQLTASWGDSGSAPGQLSAISALAVTPAGEVAVACIATELGIQMFDRDGRYLRGFGVHDIGPGRFSQPTGIVATPEGRLWVLDAVRANLQVFDTTGTLLDAVTAGAAGDWLYPSGLATNGHGLFALTEMGGNRLQLLWITGPAPSAASVLERGGDGRHSARAGARPQ